jgi:hypothetical protein
MLFLDTGLGQGQRHRTLSAKASVFPVRMHHSTPRILSRTQATRGLESCAVLLGDPAIQTSAGRAHIAKAVQEWQSLA